MKDIEGSSTSAWFRFFGEGVIVLILMGLFVLLKSYSLNPAVSDENIYFYNSWLMSRDLWPYKDFFFAHPPLHLIPGWLLMLVAGDFHYATMKMLPVAAATVTGLCVYGIARRAGGRVAAAVACAMFFFSHDLLRASSHWTGINWSVAWMSCGLLAALNGRPVLSGIMLALGTCTGVYVAPGAVIIIAMLTLWRSRDGIRCIVATMVPWLIINGVFFLIGGQGYIDGVYRYHLLKPPGVGSSLFQTFDIMLFHNFFLLTAPIYLAPVLVVWSWKSISGKGAGTGWRALFDARTNPGIATGVWSTAIYLGYIVFLANLTRVFHFYFLLMFPAAAVCGGLYIAKLYSNLCRRTRHWPAAVAMLFALGVGVVIYPSFEHKLGYFKRNVGETRHYKFPPSPLPMIMQKPIKYLLWQPSRTIGKRYTGIQFYLWHESRNFNEAYEIAEVLKNSAQSNQTIFGDSTSTPLIALLSNVPIVDNFVDTNAMRFRCGLPSSRQTVTQLQAALDRQQQQLNWVLINPRRGMANFDDLMQFFKNNFKPVKTFQSLYHGTYMLLQRTNSTSPPA